MNLKSNLVYRFLSDTPDFFKCLDILGLILVAVAGFLADNGYSGKAITIVGAIGTAVCLISKFVKKDVQLLQSSTDDLQTIEGNLQEFKDQAEAVVKTLKPVLNVTSNDQ